MVPESFSGQGRQHGTVHGHGDGNLVQRDVAEQDLHVLHGIDGHPGLAHVTHDARVVAVIAPVRRKIEGHGQPLLPGGEVAAVEGVGFLRRRETRILADGPGPVRIHRGTHAADIGVHAGQAAQMIQAGHILLRIEGLHRNAFRRLPHQIVQRLAAQFLFRRSLPVREGLVLAVGHVRLLLRVRSHGLYRAGFAHARQSNRRMPAVQIVIPPLRALAGCADCTDGPEEPAPVDQTMKQASELTAGLRLPIGRRTTAGFPVTFQ